jgi:nucleoside-diphosphate-sugar epimerase
MPVGTIEHVGDIMVEADIERVLREARPTHLLHLAWYAVPGKFWTSLENLSWVAASLHLVTEFAAVGGNRAVTAGSCAEYEWQDEVCCDEDRTPLRPRTLYGTCKNSLREMLFAAADQLGISMSWGRIFHLYGPYEPPEKLVSSVILSLLRNQVAGCTLGHQVRDFMHVDDVARALVHALDSAFVGPINLASGIHVPISQVVGTIADQLDRRHLLALGAVPRSPDDPSKLVAHIDRLKALRFEPNFNLASGIANSIEWFRAELARGTL